MTDEDSPDSRRWSDDELPTRPRRAEKKYGEREAKALLDRFRKESGKFADQADNWDGSDIGQILEVYSKLDDDLQARSPELLNKQLGILQRDLARYIDADFAQSPEDMHYVLTYSQAAIQDIFAALGEEKSAEDIAQHEDEERGEQVYFDAGFSPPLSDAYRNTDEVLVTTGTMGNKLMQAPENPVMQLPVYNSIAAIERFYNDSFPCESDKKGQDSDEKWQVYNSRADFINQEYQARKINHTQISKEEFADAMDELRGITRDFIEEVNSAKRSTSGYSAIYNKKLAVFKDNLIDIIDVLEDAWETWPPPSKGRTELDSLLETLQQTELAIKKIQERKRD